MSNSGQRLANRFHYVPALPVYFIVCARNTGRYINRCLESLRMQQGDWRAVLIDDASTDDTGAHIRAAAAAWPQRFEFRPQCTKRGKLRNFIETAQSLPEDAIIVELDGDDALLHPTFVEEMTHLHRRYDTIWTQLLPMTEEEPDWMAWYSTPLPESWSRKDTSLTSLVGPLLSLNSLRTFKQHYLRIIDPTHFIYEGRWLMTAGDYAYYIPLVESTPSRLRYFYDRPCVAYQVHAANDALRDLRDEGLLPPEEKQYVMHEHIRNLPAQKPVEITSLIVPVEEGQEATLDTWILKQREALSPFIEIHVFCTTQACYQACQHLKRYGLKLYNLAALAANPLLYPKTAWTPREIATGAAYLRPFMLWHFLEYNRWEKLRVFSSLDTSTPPIAFAKIPDSATLESYMQLSREHFLQQQPPMEWVSI